MNSPTPSFESLLSRLLDGDLDAGERDQLAILCEREPLLLQRVREELELSEFLRQTLATSSLNVAGKDDATFIGGVELRLDGETHDYADLSDRLINHEASRAEVESLALRCLEDSDHAQNLRARLEMDDYLSQANQKSRASEAFVDSLITRMWAEADEDHFVDDLALKIVEASDASPDKVVAFPGTSTKRRETPWIAIAACAVASAVALFSLLSSGSSNIESLAQITGAKGELRWEGDLQPKDGKFTETGRYRLESGTATMSFASGDSITISEGADFEIQSGNAIFVHEGVALARVGENSTTNAGLVIRSKGVNLGEGDQNNRQAGALVGVDARSTETTEAFVFNGDADVELPELGKTRKLYNQEAILKDHSQNKLYDVPYNPMRFADVWELMAGVERNAGDVKLELPGTTLTPTLRAANGRSPVQVFMENDNFVADSQFEVDTLTPGHFASTTTVGQTAGEPLNLPGKSLRSYLLQLWPAKGSGSESFTPTADETREASVTFDHEIVGVIFSSDRLEQSDSLVGQHLDLTSGEATHLRGLDGGDKDGDQILLSDDRRTLNVRLKNGGDDLLDHVRVIVALQD